MLKIIVPCLALLVIGALEAIALIKGIDGLLLTGVIAILAGCAGYKVPNISAFISAYKKGKSK
jgi:hypothetical protein